MPPDTQGRSREHLLPPGSYLYVQDGTSGKVKTFVGPIQVTLTGNDSPITYELVKGRGGEFLPTDVLDRAVRKNVVAPEGYYVVVMNPALGREGKISYPAEGAISPATPDLAIGHKVIVRGPAMFPLWPGQTAMVIRGHNLRSNQYVLCRVYNQEQAQANWGDVLLVKVTPKPVEPPAPPVEGSGALGTESGGPGSDAASNAAAAEALEEKPTEMTAEQLIVGKLFVIRGTQASFYIPPTGITVVEDEKKEYVRKAVSLEQLEYCVLLDEAGTKRYVRGPAVVFPRPTETFMRDDKQNPVFRAMEMNDIQGIQVKVTRDHTDPVLGVLKEGKEVFITGKEYPIYYPREEHALVKYDGKVKHFAVAVTEGAGRYVMARLTGVVQLVRGPRMLLPDPVEEIIVRRVLTTSECELWYPGNDRALAYNMALSQMAANAPTTRTGVVSEGDYERGTRSQGGQARAGMQKSSMMAMMDQSGVSVSNMASMADEISRGSTYNAPRTLVLNTDFEGAPRISPWTGYAVMVVNSRGARRVVVGPENILLEYDETLEILSMSTGKPKKTDNLFRTPYLRVENNMVSDIISVETSDNVTVNITVSYLVNFIGEDRRKWFAVENYTKFLCDRIRSKLKAEVRTVPIADFYAASTPIVREVVLGDDEAGTLFPENSMMLAEVEVLTVDIVDPEVANLLRGTQKQNVSRNIKLEARRRDVDALLVECDLEVKTAMVKSDANKQIKEQEAVTVTAELALTLRKLEALITKHEKGKEALLAESSVEDEKSKALLTRETNERSTRADLRAKELDVDLDAEIRRRESEADALMKKLSALSGGFTEALLALTSQEAMIKITQAGSVQQMIGAENALQVIGNMFQGTGLAKALEGLVNRTVPGLPATTSPTTGSSTSR